MYLTVCVTVSENNVTNNLSRYFKFTLLPVRLFFVKITEIIIKRSKRCIKGAGLNLVVV